MDRSGDVARPEGIDERESVIATYRYRVPIGLDVHRAAQGLAELQSTGAWVELAGETEDIRERHAARVIATWQVPSDELDAPNDMDAPSWNIQIAYPAHNIGAQIPLLLATVYGECASWRDLKLIDLELPESFVRGFAGPRFGVEGIRDLVGVSDRPLLITIMKPAIGLTPSESASVFYQAAIGGSDAVKDDEKLVSHPWSHFLDRVREHERMALVAFEETGHRTLYFVNITDRPDRLVENAHRAIEAGATALLVDFLTVGVSALSMLADDPDVSVPIMAHLAFAGAIYGSAWSGVSSHLVLGTLPRLAGADVVVYPSPGGTLPFPHVQARRLTGALTEPLHSLKRALPLAGGGMHAGMVPRLVDDLGIDWAIGAGGAVHGHPMGIVAGARAIRQAIDAALRGEPLGEAAEAHPELAAALHKWPEGETQSEAIVR
jgi:2,3-diketo-5-methylthiopentyl-1-phosphate enolase